MFVRSFKIEDIMDMRINVYVLTANSLCMRGSWISRRSRGRMDGRSRGVPWRPCRFPIKQMLAGARATPQASGTGVHLFLLSWYTSTNMPLSLSFSLRERVSIVARVVWHAKFQLDSPREFSLTFPCIVRWSLVVLSNRTYDLRVNDSFIIVRRNYPTHLNCDCIIKYGSYIKNRIS